VGSAVAVLRVSDMFVRHALKACSIVFVAPARLLRLPISLDPLPARSRAAGSLASHMLLAHQALEKIFVPRSNLPTF